MMKIRHSLQSLSVLSAVGILLLAAGSAHATSFVHFIGGGSFSLGFDLSAPPDYTAQTSSFEGTVDVSPSPSTAGTAVSYSVAHCVRAMLTDPCGGAISGEDFFDDVLV